MEEKNILWLSAVAAVLGISEEGPEPTPGAKRLLLKEMSGFSIYAAIWRRHRLHPCELLTLKRSSNGHFAHQLPSMKLTFWMEYSDFRHCEFVSTEAVFALELFAIDSHTCSVCRENTLVWNNIIHNESSVLWSPAIPRGACAVSHAVICKHSYKHSKPDSYLV